METDTQTVQRNAAIRARETAERITYLLEINRKKGCSDTMKYSHRLDFHIHDFVTRASKYECGSGSSALWEPQRFRAQHVCMCNASANQSPSSTRPIKYG